MTPLLRFCEIAATPLELFALLLFTVPSVFVLTKLFVLPELGERDHHHADDLLIARSAPKNSYERF